GSHARNLGGMKRGTLGRGAFLHVSILESGNGNSGESEGFAGSSGNSRANSLAKVIGNST
ncbi:hypothetical protein KAR02_15480, partial [Candidatus Bipolaricaulota bacterium]|nr:hypothetical protein [Candidatus Bipolaricaulota bacterium]